MSTTDSRSSETYGGMRPGAHASHKAGMTASSWAAAVDHMRMPSSGDSSCDVDIAKAFRTPMSDVRLGGEEHARGAVMRAQGYEKPKL
ncbi:hypothetical protein A9Z42_0049710 [Trichoderma parareesei]|uniref:Uncharacterized protein n=1 Tax=Trichoderma parareesei TaxID=858221 RepID=A0A2H2ZEV1_TRIPA|nr:hypothetical protein A9Z42_0049710 [Trichoderma parareesei]